VVINVKVKSNTRKGIALLVILFIIMAAAIISVGVIVKSDLELVCGKNLTTRMEMDYLAQSALTHARTLLLYPTATEAASYWLGDGALQIDASSNDYYDIAVTQKPFGDTRRLDYQISVLAYRHDGAQRVAQFPLIVDMHLEPCIAYWQTAKKDLPAVATIYGDMYCNDSMKILGYVDGDVYALKGVVDAGTVLGSLYPNTSSLPVTLPGITAGDFSANYYINATSYLVQQITPGLNTTLDLGTSASNPAGVHYCSGNLNLDGTCSVNGTLVVNGDLTLEGTCSLTVIATKNLPAIIVANDLLITNTNVSLDATGFVQIGNHIDMQNNSNAAVNVLGALYIFGDGLLNTSGTTITVTADPAQAALKTYSAGGDATLWTAAADAIYKSIN
jgi:hypothetical protein